MVRPGRLIAIGDIHGHANALDSLLSTVRPSVNDHFVFLGDYIDHGPDSYGVIETLISFASKYSSTFILGNHEEMLLASLKEPEYKTHWLSYGGDSTIKAYENRGSSIDTLPDKHISFLQSCVSFYRHQSFIFTHATISSSDLRKNTNNDLRWKFFESQERIKGKTIVSGHTPQKDGLPNDKGYAICVDTNISNGGALTAFNVLNRHYWQVDASGSVLAKNITGYLNISA